MNDSIFATMWLTVGCFLGFWLGIAYPQLSKNTHRLPIMRENTRYLVPRIKEVGKQKTVATLDGSTDTELDSTVFYYDTITVK